MRNLAARCLAGALLLFAGVPPIPMAPPLGQAEAQVSRIPRPVPTIQVPCCRCVDGAQHQVVINTGVAPWRVTTPTPPITQPQAPVPASNLAWTNALAPASWVSHANGSQVGDYVYELRIEVPRCMIAGRVVLTGGFSADNGAKLYLIQGSNPPVQIAAAPPPTAFQNATPFPNQVLQPGNVYTLRAIVTNLHGPSGFILRGQVSVACPRDPAIGPGPVLDHNVGPDDPR